MADESVNARYDVSRQFATSARDDLQETGHHPQGTDHESDTTATLLHNVETNKGKGAVDGSENELGGVTVANTGGGEGSSTEVEEEVGTGELLAGLEGNAEQSAVKHARASEDLVPGRVGESAVLLKLGVNLIHLLVNSKGVGVGTSKLGDGVASLLHAALAVSITGTLGKEQDTTTEDQSPGKGETVGNSPSGAVGSGLCAPVDHLSSPDTQGDEKLVGGDEHTTDDGGTALRLVHGNDDRQRANAETSDETTDGKLNPVVRRRDLDDGADEGEQSRTRDDRTAAEGIGQLSGDQGTKQAPDTEKTDDGTLAGGTEGVRAVRLQLTESTSIVVHQEEAGDLTTSRVLASSHRCISHVKSLPDITEHETTDTGDETQETGEEGDSLILGMGDMIHVGLIAMFPLGTLLEERHGWYTVLSLLKTNGGTVES